MAETSDSISSSLLESLPQNERDSLSLELEAFVVQHASFHRPVALVSSGGTAADLERHSVRCLDNFSTGLRGSMSVEGFLRRGYAVIHLWRQGSASPFARVLSQQLELAPHAALDVNAMGRLFGVDQEEEEEEASLRHVLQNEDPWLERNSLSNNGMLPHENGTNQPPQYDTSDNIRLSRGLCHSSVLQKALRERRTVLQENRLLTIPFRTVDEYLAKLQLCSQAIHCCHSLALVYLAAAVSDFYVPLEERSEHKIQSASARDGLKLHLKPVPKTIGLLRSSWAPSAFCVSFKLETDLAILRTKAERAVQAYGVHMVIGNILETRHSKVWILAPETQRSKTPTGAQDWPFEEVYKSSSIATDLEDLILDKVVEAHFEFLSWHIQGDGVDAARQAQETIKEKRRKVQNQLFWRRANAVGMEVVGYVLSGLLSWAVAIAIQKARGGR